MNKNKCKHCGIETGGADCCFRCLLENSPKARIIFNVALVLFVIYPFISSFVLLKMI